jgi:hypothetical protein
MLFSSLLRSDDIDGIAPVGRRLRRLRAPAGPGAFCAVRSWQALQAAIIRSSMPARSLLRDSSRDPRVMKLLANHKTWAMRHSAALRSRRASSAFFDKIS